MPGQEVAPVRAQGRAAACEPGPEKNEWVKSEGERTAGSDLWIVCALDGCRSRLGHCLKPWGRTPPPTPLHQKNFPHKK